MKWLIPKISDSTLFEFFYTKLFRDRMLTPEMALHAINIKISDHYEKTCLRDEPINDEAFEKIIDTISKSQAEIISQIDIFTLSKEINLSYKRTADPIYDEFEVELLNSYGTQYRPTPTDIEFFSNTHKELILISGKSAANWNIDPDRTKATYQVLEHLQKLSANILQEQAQHREALESEKLRFVEKQKISLETEVYDLNLKFEDRRKILEEAYKTKDADLALREAAINNADNTTARRKTTSTMLTQVDAKASGFEFSKSVSSKRLLIAVAILALIVAGLINILMGGIQLDSLMKPKYITGEMGIQSLDTTAPNQWLIGLSLFRILGGTFLTLSSIIYFIKWQNQWTNRLAAIELDYQKFSRDLSRSDLTIEMCLEWNDKKEGKIPEILLQAMTENLFKETQNSKPEELLHPAEHLAAAILRTAERIDFPLGGASVTTTGKRLDKATPTPKENN